MRNVSDKRKKKSEHKFFALNDFLSENPAVYEIMWKKKYGRARLATDDSVTRRRKDVMCMPGN